MSLPRPAYRRVGLAFGSVFLVLVLVQYLAPGLPSRLDAVTRPQQYTELYFAAPSRLPSGERPGGTVRFSFVLVDAGQHEMRYRWEVLVVGGGGASTTERHGTTVLGAGRTATIAVGFRWPGRTGRAGIEVRLPATGEAITFHVASLPARRTGGAAS